ncbi:DUF6221 family protein [Streptomyces sp. NPDC051994]
MRRPTVRIRGGSPRAAGLIYALRVLAQSYAEHPAYRQEWRP